jgi:hypothetical protein
MLNSDLEELDGSSHHSASIEYYDYV